MATYDDLNTSAIAVVGFVGTVIVLAIILLLMIVFHRVEARQQHERAESVDKTYVEVSDLVARQEGRLADYGWARQEKGVARIPVTRAMDLVVGDLARDPGASVTGVVEAAVEATAEKAVEPPEGANKEEKNAP